MSNKVNYLVKVVDAKLTDIRQALERAGIKLVSILEIYKEEMPAPPPGAAPPPKVDASPKPPGAPTPPAQPKPPTPPSGPPPAPAGQPGPPPTPPSEPPRNDVT